jgi:hypothetical protein
VLLISWLTDASAGLGICRSYGYARRLNAWRAGLQSATGRRADRDLDASRRSLDIERAWCGAPTAFTQPSWTAPWRTTATGASGAYR